MKKTFYCLLFASALVPVSVLAQDAAAPDQAPLVLPEAQQQGGESVQTPAAGTDGMAPAGDAGMAPAEGTAEQQPAPVDDGAISVETVTITPEEDTFTGETFVTVPPEGAWRVADLVGKDVFGSDQEDIGEINDVIVGQTGEVIAVIVGVGGFLGIGEKDVAVSMQALEFGPGMTEAEVAARSDAASGTGETDLSATPIPEDPETTGAVEADNSDMTAVNEPVDVEIGEDALPSRIVLNVTREDLEQAPAFEGIRSANIARDLEEGGAMEDEELTPAPAQ